MYPAKQAISPGVVRSRKNENALKKGCGFNHEANRFSVHEVQPKLSISPSQSNQSALSSWSVFYTELSGHSCGTIKLFENRQGG